MKKIKLLDCTLRDGGYINNWDFGEEHIESTIHLLEKANIDILELGFLRDEASNPNRTIFQTTKEVNALIPEKEKGILYAAMTEVFHPVPMENIEERNEKSVDIIRIIVWKDKHDESGKLVDALQEGYEYCKGFAEKGYDIFVQPARVEQYSDEEFIAMLKLYSSLNPKAIYIVDSWGTMYSEQVYHYLKLADENLPEEISIGFHGHNNLMQAFSNAVDFIHFDTERELILDSSIYGMGRGAGNLNTEIIAKYLNETENKHYDIRSFFEVYEKSIRELTKKYLWGYSPEYFFTAYHHANPQYGTWYSEQEEVKSTEIERILSAASYEDRVMYSASKAEQFLHELKEKNSIGERNGTNITQITKVCAFPLT